MQFWVARHDPDVLVVSFEDLMADKVTWIKVIGRFIGLGDDVLTDAQISRVAEMTSKEFMSRAENIRKFDESAIVEEVNAAGHAKVKMKAAARVDLRTHKERVEVDDAARAIITQQWAQAVEPATGLGSYDEMRAQWMQEIRATRPELFD